MLTVTLLSVPKVSEIFREQRLTWKLRAGSRLCYSCQSYCTHQDRARFASSRFLKVLCEISVFLTYRAGSACVCKTEICLPLLCRCCSLWCCIQRGLAYTSPLSFSVNVFLERTRYRTRRESGPSRRSNIASLVGLSKTLRLWSLLWYYKWRVPAFLWR